MKMRPVIAAAATLATIACLAGCGKGAEFSKNEVAQFEQGPPREMPPQARQMMQRAGSGPSNQGGPSQVPTGAQNAAEAARQGPPPGAAPPPGFR